MSGVALALIAVLGLIGSFGTHAASAATKSAMLAVHTEESAQWLWQTWTDNYNYTHYYLLCLGQGGTPIILKQIGGFGIQATNTLLGCEAESI